MSFWKRWMGKQTMVYPYYGILLSSKNKWYMQQPGWILRELQSEKANPQDYITYDSISVKFLKMTKWQKWKTVVFPRGQRGDEMVRKWVWLLKG